MFHHGTIRKYTAAMLNLFNDLEIQYEDSNGNLHARNVPVKYSSKEKYKELDNYSSEQLLAGNVNVLPRAAITLSTLMKAEQRIQNKNLKINQIKTDTSLEYMYNSVPYEFTYELAVMCRGMNEAAMIIEQVAPKFNPIVNIDVWDAENLNEPTRVPVKLLDIGIETNEYDELSSNIVTVSFGLSIMGNIYPPVKSIERVKEFKMRLAQQVGTTAHRTTLMNWDVDLDTAKVKNENIVHVDTSENYKPYIVSIIGSNIVQGANNLEVLYHDYDNKLSELTFEWHVLNGPATIAGTNKTAVLTVTGIGAIEVQCKITDIFGNYATFAKTFTILSQDATADSMSVTSDSTTFTADKL